MQVSSIFQAPQIIKYYNYLCFLVVADLSPAMFLPGALRKHDKIASCRVFALSPSEKTTLLKSANIKYVFPMPWISQIIFVSLRCQESMRNEWLLIKNDHGRSSSRVNVNMKSLIIRFLISYFLELAEQANKRNKNDMKSIKAT